MSAGLYSVFSALFVELLLIADYRKGELDNRSRQFKILTAMGANPIIAQIATQVSQVFVLPFVIGVILVLVNRKEDMGVHKAGPLLNAGLVAAFLFACFIAYTGIMALRQFF